MFGTLLQSKVTVAEKAEVAAKRARRMAERNMIEGEEEERVEEDGEETL